MIHVSYGKGKHGAPGDVVEFDTWQDFADDLAQHFTTAAYPQNISPDLYNAKKKNLPWVMRAIDESCAFDSSENKYHRRIGSVTSCDWLMFDADKMPGGSYDAMQAWLRDENLPFIMYRSAGNGLDCKGGKEAFRIFIQTTSAPAPVAEAVSKDMRENWFPDLGGEWDPAGDQPTRIMYLGFADALIECEDGEPLDVVKYFTDYDLTIIKSAREGLARGEADVRSFGPFVDWCLSNVEDAILIQKPDGRVALQMPGQQPEKYSGGSDGGDGWNFYLPSGDFEMLVFHSLHEITEPADTFKIQQAVNVLAREYSNDAAKHYAQGVRDAMAASTDADQRKEVVNDIDRAVSQARAAMFRNTNADLPECGDMPIGSETLVPIAFSQMSANEWPRDLDWDPGNRPEDPGEDASDARKLQYEEALYDYMQDVERWEREYQENRMARHKFFNDSYVLVANGARVADLNKHPAAEPLKLRDWEILNAPRAFDYKDGDKVKSKTFAAVWISSEARRAVDNVGYKPGEPRVYNERGETLINRFYVEPFEYTQNEDLLAPFFWLVDRTHAYEKEREIFLDWLAFSFRYPQQRILWAYTNISEARGSGRGTLKQIIELVMGNHNVKTADVDIVDKNQYHDWMHECTVSVIEEADEKASGGRVRISGNWNEAITANRRMLNLKYGSNGTHYCYNNMVLFLNEYSIIIDQEDRRIQAITGAPANTPKMTREEVASLQTMIRNPEFRDQLCSFLWDRDLTDFNPTISDTTLPARERLIGQSTSINDDAVHDLLENLPAAVIPGKMVRVMIDRLLEGSKTLKPEAVTKILQAATYKKETVTSSKNGSHRCWFFEDPNGQPRGWAATEMDKCFKSFMNK